MKNNLPKGWELKKLGSITDINIGKTPPRSNPEYFKGTNVWLSIRDMKTSQISQSSEKLTDEAIQKFNIKAIKQGTLLMSFKLTLGKLAFANCDLYTNEAIASLPINKDFLDIVDKKYLFFALQFIDLEVEMDNAVKGKTLNKEKLKNLNVPIPPISEQKKIITILENSFAKIDKSIALVKENICKIKQLDESAFSQVFEKLLNEKATKKKLVEIADVKRGKSKHRPRNDKRLYDGNYPLIQTGDIRNAGKFITQFSQTYNETGLAQSKLWEKGTVCLTIAANIGDVAILGIDACFPDSVVGIHSKTEDNIYIYYFLKSIKKQLDDKSSASAQKNLSVEKLSDFYIPIPSLAKQQQIVSHLDQLTENNNKLLHHYQNKLEALQRLKNSVLESAFKGEFKKEQKAKTFNLAFYQMQLIGLSIEANKYNNIPQGEMAIAKDMYLLDRLFQVPTKMNFANHNLGPFAPEIKKGITNKTHFDKKNFPNSQATYVVTKNEEELFKTVSADLKSQVFNGISELNRKLFSKISPYKRAEAKELFATVLKCIEDTQSTDLSTIREAMKNWKIKIGQFKTKFDKFPESNTQLVIKFIVKENWHLKVLK